MAMRKAWLIVVVALSLALGLCGIAVAAVDVSLSIQGAGSVLDQDGDPWFCETGQNENPPAVECGAPVHLNDGESMRLEAVPAPLPTGHWEFNRWDGSGCVHPPDEPAEVCVISTLLSSGSVNPVAVFDDVKPPTIGEITELRSGEGGRTVTFEFVADEDATFTCRLVDVSQQDCTGTGAAGAVTYENLAAGEYAFSVWGADASGQIGIAEELAFTIAPPPTTKHPVTPPPATTPPVVKPPVVFPALLIPRLLGPSDLAARVSRKRTFSLGKTRVKCPAVAAPCRASAVVKGRLAKGRKPVVVARKSFRVRPSSSSPVKLRLTRKAAKAIVRQRRLKAVASLMVKAPNVTTRKDVAVVLRAPKR